MADGAPVALVTGAAGGLGREVARRLADAGHHVVISARDPRRAAATAGELGAGVSALPVGLDLLDGRADRRVLPRRPGPPLVAVG